MMFEEEKKHAPNHTPKDNNQNRKEQRMAPQENQEESKVSALDLDHVIKIMKS